MNDRLQPLILKLIFFFFFWRIHYLAYQIRHFDMKVWAPGLVLRQRQIALEMAYLSPFLLYVIIILVPSLDGPLHTSLKTLLPSC